MGPQKLKGQGIPRMVAKGMTRVTVIPVNNYIQNHNNVNADYYFNQNFDIIILRE